MFTLPGAKLRCRCHSEFAVNTKQIHSIALGKVQEESNPLETDRHNEKHAKQKYRFVEADLPVIWFQVPLKKDKITACGGQPQDSIICIANGRYIRHVGSPKRVRNPNPSHTTHEMMSTLSMKHHFYHNLTPRVQSRDSIADDTVLYPH